MSTTQTESKTMIFSKIDATVTGIFSNRVFVYDLDTHQEVASNLGFRGVNCLAIKDGARYKGTALSVDVVDFTTGEMGSLTADSFPGRRVAVKIWSKAHGVEWRMLVSRADGWQGNEAATTGMPERMALKR